MEKDFEVRDGDKKREEIETGDWIKVESREVWEVEKEEEIGGVCRILARALEKVEKDGEFKELFLSPTEEKKKGVPPSPEQVSPSPEQVSTGPTLESSTSSTLKKGEEVNEKKLSNGERVSQFVPDFGGDGETIFLGLEGYRFRLLHRYEPLLPFKLPKIDPLPHQLEAVYSYILKLPRIRFLVADDPGAGKTIIAGLVIKELLTRKLIKRILIVVPGHLKEQWRLELEEKFGERFVIVDRNYLQTFYHHSPSKNLNPFRQERLIITSLDFAKRPENLARLEETQFDLIVVDEAHKMHARRNNRKIEKSQRYRLGELLSQIGYHLLFLTATPHDGNPESFRLFLKLLRPDLINSNFSLSNLTRLTPPIIIRRLKEDLRDFSGRPLFKPRQVKTLSFEIGEEEIELYNHLSEYVQRQYSRALSSLSRRKRRNVAFALIILQRRFASSIYALLNSLRRRKERLEELLKLLENRRRTLAERRESGERGIREKGQLSLEEEWDEIEELEERERWQKENELEGVTASQTAGELKREIEELDLLIEQAERILKGEKEVKLRELRESLEKLSREFPGKKVIIFTESKDTLDYLSQKLEEWGYSVAVIHGGMEMGERRKAEELFRRERQILVATEAAGEGINLQFCNLMINYDIPWNPNRLEQRMGRIHRYGQREVAHIYNLVAKNTREGEVLNRLLEKLENIREALGSDKVFDVISEIFEGEKLSKLLMEAAVNSKPQPDLLRELEEGEEERIAQLRRQVGRELSTSLLHYSETSQLLERRLEWQLEPEYLEAFFLRAYRRLGGGVEKRGDGLLKILSIPEPLKKIGEREEFLREFGSLPTPPFWATFDKTIAQAHWNFQLLSFGSPLFEALLTYWWERSRPHLLRGGLFFDPDRRLDGYLFIYQGTLSNWEGEVVTRRLIPVYIDRKTSEPKVVDPTLLWDLKPVERWEKLPSLHPHQFRQLRQIALPTALFELEQLRQQFLLQRRGVGKRMERWLRELNAYLIQLTRHLSRLAWELNRASTTSLRRVSLSRQYQLFRQRQHYYIQLFKQLKERWERGEELFLKKPLPIGLLQVVPMPEGEREEKGGEGGMRSDREIEEIGMEVAMEFERREGRIPEDVSAQNLGFDIRSWEVGPNGRRRVARYIEVKARAREGEVALTPNEWFKAHRFREKYYLYVVLNAATTPELIVIQNPAEKLKPVEKVVRYICPLATILEKGEVKWNLSLKKS